jgi:hypothetical protein
MATASKKAPGGQGALGSARYASGVVAVSKDEKDGSVNSDVITPDDAQTREKKDRRAPAVLDRWFDAQLGRLYADVASEPVPVEMLHLISKLKKPKQSGS